MRELERTKLRFYCLYFVTHVTNFFLFGYRYLTFNESHFMDVFVYSLVLILKPKYEIYYLNLVNIL